LGNLHGLQLLRLRSLCLVPIAFSMLFLQGCSSNSSFKQDPSITISVAPTAASVVAAKTQQFAATVTGTTNMAVTWQVNSVTGGDSTHGTISTSGLYTAPSAVPNPATVTVTAVAQADSTKSASAAVAVTAAQVPVAISISPTSASVATTKTQQFAATVTGTTNMAVTWQVNSVTGGDSTHGTISTSGLYTAPSAVPNPATVTVTAIAQADSTKSASASVTVMTSGSSNITVSVSPRRDGLTVTQQLSTLKATLTNDTTNAGVTWSSSGGGSFSPTTSLSGVAVTFTAPSSAGVVTITATSVADGSKTATATIGVTDLAAVSTYLNGNLRQGGNLQEHALATSGPTAVNSTNFGKLFSCTVDAPIYAQPLWVANLTIGGAKHNVVYVATEHDTVYAFDADANPCTTLWQTGANSVNSLLPSGQTWVTSSDTGCGDLTPDIGIVGTPVIDLGTNTLYVVTKSKTSTPSYHQLLHALDITTGAEKFSGSVEISGSVSGTGNGSSGGVVNFDPLLDNQRSALLLENGHLIIAWASHCDNGAYLGWLMSFSSSSLAREAVFSPAPNGIQTGIWMSGGGPAADANGNIYFATGNGTFDVTNSTGPTNDYGDSIVKLGLASGGAFPISSYFRSSQQQPSPDFADSDQGSGGIVLSPTSSATNYAIQAGKDGIIYVLNQSNLGGYNPSSNNIVQEVSGQLPGGMWASPTYWNGNLYFAGANNGLPPVPTNRLLAFSFNTSTGLMSTTPTSSSASIFKFPAPTVPISSTGTSNGIAWAIDNSSYCTSSNTTGCGSAVIHAYDATNLATEFWNSGSTAGNAVKFTVPTVANGKVYVGTRGNNTGGATSSSSVPGELDVYGLLP
jgi:hypothetical protein